MEYIEEVIEVLEKHNKWRRGGEGDMIDPKKIGVAINTAIHILKNHQRITQSSYFYSKSEQVIQIKKMADLGILVKAQSFEQDISSLINELKQKNKLLDEIDDLLSQIEDDLHGDHSDKVTKIRKLMNL